MWLISAMAQRIEVFTLSEDGRAKTYEENFSKIVTGLKRVRVIDVYTLEEPIQSQDQLEECLKSFTNPVTQKAFIIDEAAKPANDYWQAVGDFDWALEIGYLPGVTDNIGHTASELTELTLKNERHVYSSKLLLIEGDIQQNEVKKIAAELHNPLIQRASNKNKEQFKSDNGMGITLPKVQLDNQGIVVDDVDLNISDADLAKIGKEGITNADGTRRGPLGMSLHYMKAVQEHFKKLGRNPTDVELETLAQTWSEHCKHTIFASPIDEITDGLYKYYIKGATNEIRKERGNDD